MSALQIVVRGFPTWEVGQYIIHELRELGFDIAEVWTEDDGDGCGIITTHITSGMVLGMMDVDVIYESVTACGSGIIMKHREYQLIDEDERSKRSSGVDWKKEGF